MNEPTIPKIKKAVAEGFQVSVKDIDSRVRRQPIAIARQTVYYYARKLLGMKYIDLGEKFNRTNANIIHAVKTIEDSRTYDVEIQTMLNGLESEFPWLRGEEVEVKA
jgi:chromosomal replication initiation ATPase DnaA